MATEFCAHCFAELQETDEHCPACSRPRATGWQTESFDKRLVHALTHPVSEVRMRAIFALGRRGILAAIEPLVACALASPSDVVQGQAVAVALADMPDKAGHDALVRLSANHPARPVQVRAHECLRLCRKRAALPNKLQSRAGEAVRKAVSYLYSRQSDSGGFCFYRSEYIDEPNLFDTFHAVAALKSVGDELPRTERITKFLGGHEVVGLDALYYHARTYELLGRTSDIREEHLAQIHQLGVSLPHEHAGQSVSGWLNKTIMILDLKHRFGVPQDDEVVLGFVESLKDNDNGGYGNKPNLIDTYSCLWLRNFFGAYEKEPATQAFVERLQTPSQGFVMTDDSRLASLEVLYAGIRCCTMLGIPVKFPDVVFASILACQSPNGGFARTSGALPDIEMTDRAVHVLHSIDTSF